MQYYFAPMEGVTSAVYRRVHHRYFPGEDKYFTPFATPTVHPAFTPRQMRDLSPEQNAGVPTVPQLLTRSAADFIWAARALAEMGYGEVNLNLGCPSGTVVSKGKGSGFLAYPDELDCFLDAVFGAVGEQIQISVKTRLGVSDPAEFSPLLTIYNRYPIAELTIHPRIRADFYKGGVRESAFADALSQTDLPLCYNGDVTSAADAARVEQTYPAVGALMIGRGLIADPSLVTRLRGGAAADADTLHRFHDELFDCYTESFGSRKNAMLRMKELWFYHIHLFEGGEKLMKRLRKATELRDFEACSAEIFRTLQLRENVHPGWFRPAD